MKVKATRDFSNTTFGYVSQGDVIDVSEGMAKHFSEFGLAEPYETKVIERTPKPAKPRKKTATKE